MLLTGFPRFTTCVLALIAALFTTPSASGEWKEKVLYSFQGGPRDGYSPTGGVVFDKAGNLYGATTGWGSGSCAPIANECGLVYELSPPSKQGGSWKQVILYEFKGKGSNDGSVPEGGLLIDGTGNLYGTTGYGGTGDCVLLGVKAGCGIVYELSPPAKHGDPWTRTILYSFKSGNDGYFPSGDLTFDGNGNLYGATLFGGGKGSGLCDPFYQYCGTVFKLSRPKQKGRQWMEQVLHSFAAGSDGYSPNGGLILDSKGSIYGTTPMGGNELCNFGDYKVGCGIVFELTPPIKRGGAWAEKSLHIFTGGDDGYSPLTGLTRTKDESVYGSAGGGGLYQRGLVFRLSRVGSGPWVESVLYNFTGQNDGQGPVSPLRFDRVGSLYGTAIGGQYFSGVVFQLRPPSAKGNPWAYRLLYAFRGRPDGHYPGNCLIIRSQGDLYGTTDGGGSADDGTVFSLRP